MNKYSLKARIRKAGTGGHRNIDKIPHPACFNDNMGRGLFDDVPFDKVKHNASFATKYN
jgi:hypothetical protein